MCLAGRMHEAVPFVIRRLAAGSPLEARTQHGAAFCLRDDVGASRADWAEDKKESRCNCAKDDSFLHVIIVLFG